MRALHCAGASGSQATWIFSYRLGHPLRDGLPGNLADFLLFRYGLGSGAVVILRGRTLMRELDAIEILEESIQLLRAAPSAAIAAYLAGAVPFFAGLLFFWTDMSRNPFAAERLPAESLALAALFIWKSVWQAVFAARLYWYQALTAPRPLKLIRLVAIQCTLQPLSLLAIPVSGLVMLPFAWTVAFFRNAGLFAALGETEIVAVARRQAGLWNRQNWLLLSLIFLAGLLLFINVLIVIVLLPQMGRSLLGIENEFARLGMRLLNSTTIAVAACVMWLVIDPLLDAAYVVRCFHGESLATGEDLRVALKRALGAVALAFVLCVSVPQVRAQTAPTTDAANVQTSIDPQRLDHTINEVIRRREFAWRTPRPAGPEPQGRWVGWVRSALDTGAKGIAWIAEKIQSWFRRNPDENSGKKPATERPPIELWISLVAIALVAAGMAAFMAGRRKKAIVAQPVKLAIVPIDLADESVTADQMPESSWLQLAEELLAKGDCRLALRALYLAGLNYLGQKDLISVRRWKSGRDYRQELERRSRAHALTDANLTPAFARNLFLFERGWYGRHAVDRADVEAFAQGWEEIRRYAGRP